MNQVEFKARHQERCRKVLMREMPLVDALAENDRDWNTLWPSALTAETPATTPTLTSSSDASDASTSYPQEPSEHQ